MLQCRTQRHVCQPHKSIAMMSCFCLSWRMNWPTFQGLRSMCCLKAVQIRTQRVWSQSNEQRRPRLDNAFSEGVCASGGVHSQANMFQCTGKFASQMRSFAILARRAGVVPREGEVPRVIRQQRWSPLNVPLLWSAAGVEETSPVLDWLASVAGTMHQDVEFHEGVVNFVDAVRVGFCSSEDSYEVLGNIHPVHQISPVVSRPGFRNDSARQPHPSTGARILDRGGVQVRCSSGIVGSVLRSCDIACGPTNGRPTRFRPRWRDVAETGASVGENQRWAQLDAVELNDWMLRRVPMLKTCPRFMRGRFRQCWGTALRGAEQDWQVMSCPSQELRNSFALCLS